MKKKKKKRVSPMRGRKISKEDRGPNAPKLGRPFSVSEGKSEVIRIALTLPEGTMDRLTVKAQSGKSASVREAILKYLE